MGNKNQACMICTELAADVRDVINRELSKPPAERMTLRELEQIAHVSKATLSRHSNRCLSKQTLRHARYVEDQPIAYQQSDGSYLIDGVRFETEDSLPHDAVILFVEYYDAPIGNPSALLSKEERTERNKKPAETFTSATQPSQPVEAGKIAPEPNAQQQSQPDTPVTIENSCPHAWTRITVNTRRCQNCGLQESVPPTKESFVSPKT